MPPKTVTWPQMISPFVTSGIRVGTAAVTTRGMKEAEMEKIVDLIDDVLMNKDNDGKLRIN